SHHQGCAIAKFQGVSPREALRAAPVAGWREEVVVYDVEQRGDTIPPANLLALSICTTAIRDRQLPDARVCLREACGDLDFEPEPIRCERQTLEQVAADELVTGFDVGEVQVAEDIGEQREEAIPDGVPEEEDSPGPALETRAVHRIGESAA